MQRFSVTEIQNIDSQALHQAESEPVLLTAESQSSYVIMSVENYDRLIYRLERLEDIALVQPAQAALSTSRIVGTEIFTAELQRIEYIHGHTSSSIALADRRMSASFSIQSSNVVSTAKIPACCIGLIDLRPIS